MRTAKINRHHFKPYAPPKGPIRRARHALWLFRKRNTIRQVTFADRTIMILPTEWVAVASQATSLRKSVLHASDHTVVLINKKQRIVARVSYSRAGNYKIRSSIDSFNSASNLPHSELLDQSPAKSRYLWHTETLINADEVNQDNDKPLANAMSIYADQLSGKTLSFKDIETVHEGWRKALPPAYRTRFNTFAKAAKKSYGKQTPFLVSPLHGDLTYRNCLENDTGFYYIDWDRHAILPPELDYLLYLTDQHVQTIENPVGYTDYIDRISSKSVIKKQLKSLYSTHPQLSLNKKHFDQLQCILLYRFTLLSAVNSTHPNNYPDGLALIDAAESKLP